MHPNDGRVVSNFIMQALRGQDITVYGDGSQTRCFCYVSDLIEAIVRTMDTREDFTGPVNIGASEEFTIRELAERIIRLTGTAAKVVYRDLPSDDPVQRQPELGLAREHLAWESTTSLEEGLQRTIDYFAATSRP
jgi:UDP-glucuronate decarboxylase